MAAPIVPRRSVLYMPGSNARALDKARTLPADVLILDLEDAVAPDAKAIARAQVAEAVKAGGFGHREVVVRVNGLATPWGEADIAAIAPTNPAAILVPKVSTGAEVKDYEARIAAAGADAGVALWTMIETPLAILNLKEIAAAGGRLSCFVMGTNDLVKEFRGRHTPGREGLLPSLVLALAAARAYGLAALDGVYNDIQDEAGFAAVCVQGASMGFDGKTLIHPSQVGPCNAAFAPSDAEVAAARKIIAAFDSPENAGKGAISLDGRMVELLHADIARRTVALAEAIAARAA